MGKPVKPPKRQHTVQVCAYAVQIKDSLHKSLQDQSPHVPSAAILAFSRLSIEQQLVALKESRDLHLVPRAAEGQ